MSPTVALPSCGAGAAAARAVDASALTPATATAPSASATGQARRPKPPAAMDAPPACTLSIVSPLASVDHSPRRRDSLRLGALQRRPAQSRYAPRRSVGTAMLRLGGTLPSRAPRRPPPRRGAAVA